MTETVLTAHDLRRIIDTPPSKFQVDEDTLVDSARTPVFTHTWRWDNAVDGNRTLELVVVSYGERQPSPHGTCVVADSDDFTVFLDGEDVTPDRMPSSSCFIYLNEEGQRTAGLRLSCSMPF